MSRTFLKFNDCRSEPQGLSTEVIFVLLALPSTTLFILFTILALSLDYPLPYPLLEKVRPIINGLYGTEFTHQTLGKALQARPCSPQTQPSNAKSIASPVKRPPSSCGFYVIIV